MTGVAHRPGVGRARAPRRGSAGHGYRIEHLSPLKRGMFVSGITELGTPILLLHGLADNHSRRSFFNSANGPVFSRMSWR